MCGTVGYIGHKDAYPIVIKGLKRLEYRGYNNEGIALINKDRYLNVCEMKGKVLQSEDFPFIKNISGTVSISHLRWITHDELCSTNAHPHYFSSEFFPFAHNNIIDNFPVFSDSFPVNVILSNHYGETGLLLLATLDFYNCLNYIRWNN